METKDPKKSFLEQFDPQSPEFTYYDTLLDILTALNPPRTRLYGFGCMMMLEFTTVRLRDGREIGGHDDIMGSIGDIADAVALIFQGIQYKPLWWKSRYPSEISDPRVRTTALEFIARLEGLEIVERVESDLR